LYPDYNSNQYASLELETLKKFLICGKERGLKAIEITGGGEPTVHNKFIEIIEFVKDNFELALVTNGTKLLKDEIRSSICKALWVRISIDAGTEKTFQLVHRTVAGLHKILEAAKNLKEESSDTIMGFSFVVNRTNFHEILLATKIAKNFGFSNIRFSPEYNYRGKPLLFDLEEKIFSSLDHAKREETDMFKVFTFHERISKIYKERRPAECYYAMLTSVIAANGNVYPCCAIKNETGTEIGDYEGNYDEIYSNREVISTEKCPPCWMDQKNLITGYMMQLCPIHVNFI